MCVSRGNTPFVYRNQHKGHNANSRIIVADVKYKCILYNMKYFTFVKNNWRSKGYPNFKSAVSSGDMMRAYDKRDLIDDIDEIDLDDTLNEEDKNGIKNLEESVIKKEIKCSPIKR